MKLFNFIHKIKENIIKSGIKLGKFRIISNSNYIDYTNIDKAHTSVLKDKLNEISQLKNEVKIYKQLLDSSQQVTRNYGNNKN